MNLLNDLNGNRTDICILCYSHLDIFEFGHVSFLNNFGN